MVFGWGSKRDSIDSPPMQTKPSISSQDSSRATPPRTGRTTSSSAERSIGTESSTRSRKAQPPLRFKVLSAIQEEKETSRFERLFTGARPGKNSASAAAASGRGLLMEAADEHDDEILNWELLDIVEELGLLLEPVVQELGDATLLERKRNGTLNVKEETTVTAYKRYKAMVGKKVFEGECANNIGVDHYNLGEVQVALSYFKKALECCNVELKPAAHEIGDLAKFINEKYDGDLQKFQAAISEGDARFSVGRKRFVQALTGLGYIGDADRLFTLADSIERDGKISCAELILLLQAKDVKLENMDRETLQKGIISSNIGACYMQIGDISTGLNKLREGLKITIRQARAGEFDPSVLQILGNIVVGYIRQRNYDAALNYLSTLWDTAETIFEPYATEILQILYQIGYCFLVKANRFEILNDWQRQDGLNQEDPVELNYKLALMAFKERLGRQKLLVESFETQGLFVALGDLEEYKLDVARSNEIVAEIHYHQGQLDRALPYIIEAAVMKETVLDETDPEQLTTWNIQAMMYMKAAQYEEAITTMSKTLGAISAIFDGSSHALSTVLYYMGFASYKRGVQLLREDEHAAANIFCEALEHLERVAETQKDFNLDVDLTATHQLMGNVHLVAGNRGSARQFFTEALLRRIELLGKSHIATASSAHALGSLYSRTPRRTQEAVKLLQKAASVRRRLLGPKSLHLAESLHELGSALLLRRTREDAEAALEHLSQAAKIREAVLGKKSVAYAASMHIIGQAYMHLQEFEEAHLYLVAAVSLRDALLGKKNAQTASSKHALGVTYIHKQEPALALKFLKAAYATRESLFGRFHRLSAETLHEIGVAHAKNKEPDFALTFLMQALSVREVLNDQEGETREQDSDEEPRDTKRRASVRHTRILRKRDAKRKAAEKLEKSRRDAFVRQREDEAKEMAFALEEKNATDKAALEKRRRGNMWGIVAMFNFRKKTEEPKDSELPPSESRTQPSARSTSHAFSDLDEEASGESSRSDDGFKQPYDIMQQATTVHTDIDSEVDVDECGINIQGSFAGDISATMQFIAMLHLEAKRFDEAKYYLDRAICIREEMFGPQSAELGETLHAFGQYYLGLGNVSLSLQQFRKALHVREVACGHNALSTANTCAEVASRLMTLGEVDRAGTYVSRACGVREYVFGTNDPTAKRLREEYRLAVASSMHYDPVSHGEVLPHFAKRSAQSYIHGYVEREKQAPDPRSLEDVV